MSDVRYTLHFPHKKQLELARFWFLLAICALAIAGLFSLPPVILRGPFFEELLPTKLIFDTALVIHVDLSVWVWMFAIGGVLWSVLSDTRFYRINRVTVKLAFFGAIFMSLAPFFGDPMPLKNNYIPMLRNFMFIVGLSVFACSTIFLTVSTTLQYNKALSSPLYTGLYSACLTAVLAFACFFIAGNQIELPHEIGHFHFYELLFWGGGHVLQITYTILMVVVWLWLASIVGIETPLHVKVVSWLFILTLVATVPTPFFYLVEDGVHGSVTMFTDHMRYVDGVLPAIIGIAIVIGWLKKREKTNVQPVIIVILLLSVLLFGYGGLLGFKIAGSNAIVPAHYHGSIVGITLAFMGLCYYLLPEFGYKIAGKKPALIQAWVYGIGQIFHITGLALMGGYGALRKAPGTSPEIDTTVGKALFFSGGGLAILGGLMFVVIMILCIMKPIPANEE